MFGLFDYCQRVENPVRGNIADADKLPESVLGMGVPFETGSENAVERIFLELKKDFYWEYL